MTLTTTNHIRNKSMIIPKPLNKFNCYVLGQNFKFFRPLSSRKHDSTMVTLILSP